MAEAIVLLIIDQLYESKELYDDKIGELHKKLIECFPESKSLQISAGEKSYTINKKHIYLCLKDKDGEYYDDNSLMYVLLHEYSHVLCDEIDTEHHGDKFKRIFSSLLLRAEEKGIYDSTKPMVNNYCV